MSREAVSGITLRAAVKLALPPLSPGADPMPAEPDPAQVAGLLRRNKVPLRHLPRAGALPLLMERTGWQEAAAREAGEEAALGREIEQVCRSFAEEGIVPVLFKSPGEIPYRSSNVDALVSPEALPRAVRRLERDGHILMPHYREEHKLLFHRFAAGRPVISVHLHEAISWGRVMVLPGAEVIAGSRASGAGPFRVAGARDLALATLAHALYETDEIRLNDLRILRLCAAESGFRWEDAERRAEQGGWGEGFAAILLLAGEVERRLAGASCVPREVLERAARRVAGSWWVAWPLRSLRALPPGAQLAMPWRFPKLWSKAHSAWRLIREPGRSPDERLLDLGATAWNLAANRLRLRARPAALIAISGLDGSGKSMVVSDLQAALAVCEVPARVVWSRGGFSAWMSALKRSARAALPGRIPSPGARDAKAAWLSRPVPAAVFGALVAAEQVTRSVLQVRLPRRAGITIVCDRAGVDSAAELASRRRGEPVMPLAGRIVLACAPAADLHVLLRVNPELALSRKPGGGDPVEMSRRAAVLDALARRRGMLIVDAARPADQVRDEVLDRSLRAAIGKFRRPAP